MQKKDKKIIDFEEADTYKIEGCLQNIGESYLYL